MEGDREGYPELFTVIAIIFLHLAFKSFSILLRYITKVS